jgi:hypothetical protein
MCKTNVIEDAEIFAIYVRQAGVTIEGIESTTAT